MMHGPMGLDDSALKLPNPDRNTVWKNSGFDEIQQYIWHSEYFENFASLQV
jgi:hypothetical protein